MRDRIDEVLATGANIPRHLNFNARRACLYHVFPKLSYFTHAAADKYGYAVGQGALAVVIREGDDDTLEIIKGKLGNRHWVLLLLSTDVAIELSFRDHHPPSPTNPLI